MARAIAVLVGLQAVPVGITPHVPRKRLLKLQTLESVSTTLSPSWSFPIRQVPCHREKYYSTNVQALRS